MPSATGSSPSLTRLGTSRLPIPGIPKPLLSLRDPVVRTMPHGGVRHPRSAVGVAHRPVGVSRVDWPRKSPPAHPARPPGPEETTCHPAPPEEPRSTTRTTPTTCSSSRGSRRFASDRACTSAPPTPAGSCTACGRSSTTRWTRRSAASAAASTSSCTRTAPPRCTTTPRHPGRQGAQDGAVRGRGGLHQAARGRQVRRRLVRRHRRTARCGLLGRQRAVRAARRRGGPLAGHPEDVVQAGRAGGLRRGRGPDTDFTPQSGLHKGGRVKKGVTGTRIRFWPDRQIFTKDATFTYDELVTRARQTSFIVPGLSW